MPQQLYSALQKFICLIWLWVWKYWFWRMETNLYIAADSPSWRTDRLIKCEIVESYVMLSVVKANEKSWKRIDTDKSFHQTLSGNNGTRKDSHHRWRQLNFYSGPNSRVLSRVKRRKKNQEANERANLDDLFVKETGKGVRGRESVSSAENVYRGVEEIALRQRFHRNRKHPLSKKNLEDESGPSQVIGLNITKPI